MQNLLITLGDPKSINVEILGKVLQDARKEIRHILVGSWSQWQWQCQYLALTSPLSFRIIHSFADELPSTREHLFFDTDHAGITTADATSHSQRDSFRQQSAVDALNAVQRFRISTNPQSRLAVLTMPIKKSLARSPDFPFPGQTEYFSAIWPPHQSVMILAGSRLRVGLATNHLALKDVAGQITAELLTKKLTAFRSSLQSIFGIAHPRIAVAALNPHASDQGMFGDEEQRILIPCLEKIRREEKNAHISGPFPADTVFYRAYQGAFDGVLAMYHDQGLGPLKTVHFHDAINVTGGLEHLRVSPDHGPAEDLFLKNQASAESLRMAYELCGRYLTN